MERIGIDPDLKVYIGDGLDALEHLLLRHAEFEIYCEQEKRGDRPRLGRPSFPASDGGETAKARPARRRGKPS
jgi:hypothetical protein